MKELTPRLTLFTDNRIVESQPKHGRKGMILAGVPVVPFVEDPLHHEN